MDFSSEPAYENTIAWANRKLRLASRVVSFVISELEKCTSDAPAYQIARKIDFSRVGAFGYSFGGAVAAEATILDPRIKAAVNLDGWTFGNAAVSGVAKPFFFIGTGAPVLPASAPPKQTASDDTPSGYQDEFDRRNGEQIIVAFERRGGYLLGVDGTTHDSFCDDVLIPRMKHQHVPARMMDGWRAHRVVAPYLTQFFDLYLNGVPSPLLQTEAAAPRHESRTGADPAVHLDVWRAHSQSADRVSIETLDPSGQ
jgi:hypothetical protein